MLTNSLNTSLHGLRQSPPRLKQTISKATTPDSPDYRAATRITEEDDKFRNTLKAFTGLALAATPYMVTTQAAAAEQAIVQETDTSFVDSLENLGEKAGDLKDKIDPSNYFEDYEKKVGDYTLRFRPLDLDLKPRWKSGPALRFRGEALETSLSKDIDLEDGWSMRQGVSARLRGEVSTYKEAEVDLEAGVFREYRGPVGEDFEAKIRGNLGVRHRFVGENEGLRAGISLRQELEGGNYEVFGQDFSIYAEGNQSVYYNVDTGETDAGYKFYVGPKKDFKLNVFGHEGTLTVTVGPEISGSTNGEAFDPGIGSKARLRF